MLPNNLGTSLSPTTPQYQSAPLIRPVQSFSGRILTIPTSHLLPKVSLQYTDLNATANSAHLNTQSIIKP